jgi:hypothetical protein
VPCVHAQSLNSATSKPGCAMCEMPIYSLSAAATSAFKSCGKKYGLIRSRRPMMWTSRLGFRYGVAAGAPSTISPPNSLLLKAGTCVEVWDESATGASFFKRTPREACTRAATAFGSWSLK